VDLVSVCVCTFIPKEVYPVSTFIKIIETDGGKVKGHSFILIVIVTTKMAMVNTAYKSESAVYFS